MERLLQAPITLTLLLLNLGVSGYVLMGNARLVDVLSFRPSRIKEHGEYYRFLTAGFVHANGTHLAFNMITFFFFGPLLERILGPGAFLVLFFGAEVAAHALTFVLKYNDHQYAAVGASGAISGVLFGFCLFFPLENLYLFFALPIPAIVFAFGYVAVSLYAMQDNAKRGVPGGIAHEAHLGGALAGIALTILLEPKSLQVFLQSFRDLLGS